MLHIPMNILPHKMDLHGLGPPSQLMRAIKGKEGSGAMINHRISSFAFVLREGKVGCERRTKECVLSEELASKRKR